MPSFCILVRLCSRSFKIGFSSMWTKNFRMYKLGFKEAEEPEINLPTFVRSWRKQGNTRKKKSMSASLITLKPLTVRITTNCGKFLDKWEYQTTLPVSWETHMQVKEQQLEPDMEQLTVSKLGKEYIEAVYCHPAYLTYMQNTSCEMPGWWSTSWNPEFQEKYQQPQICRWYHSNGRKWRGTKEPIDEGERGEWKSWLKTQHSKN